MEYTSFALLVRVQEDLRIGPAHISLMAAILKLHEDQGGRFIIEATGRILRKTAHIGGKAAYYRYLRDLQRLGYIRYTPFYNHKRLGRIEIVMNNS